MGIIVSFGNKDHDRLFVFVGYTSVFYWAALVFFFIIANASAFLTMEADTAKLNLYNLLKHYSEFILFENNY